MFKTTTRTNKCIHIQSLTRRAQRGLRLFALLLLVVPSNLCDKVQVDSRRVDKKTKTDHTLLYGTTYPRHAHYQQEHSRTTRAQHKHNTHTHKCAHKNTLAAPTPQLRRCRNALCCTDTAQSALPQHARVTHVASHTQTRRNLIA